MRHFEQLGQIEVIVAEVVLLLLLLLLLVLDLQQSPSMLPAVSGLHSEIAQRKVANEQS